ncbi:MBL fold metallo-hydrolase [Candidatus Saccharibacteria bacterium]|nr:MBL fold metallo-hydrolase [Candidatus Saccharibacteria bacterium]
MKQLNFIGIGGATTIELGGNCCYIKNNNNLLIIDVCEEATKKLLNTSAFNNINKIYIILTHTHYDHIAGLGVLLWYSNFYLNKTPQIVYNNEAYKQSLIELLRITGVTDKFYNFINEKSLNFDFSVNMQPTSHVSYLQCFGIMFKDEFGKYYYTGDTKDIDYIRKLSTDEVIKTIYCEVAEETYDVHIKYEDIMDLDKNKLILMHFDTYRLYKRAIKDGFRIAQMAKTNKTKVSSKTQNPYL